MSERQAGNLKRQMQRIEELVQTLETLDDPTAGAASRALVQTLLDFHRAGLERLLLILQRSEGGAAIAPDLARDELVSGLLLLHGLHPVDLPTRVGQALEQVRPLLRCHGGDLELISIIGGRIRLRLLGNCGLTTAALEQALEEAFVTSAPDVETIQVEQNAPPGERTTKLLSLPLVSE